RTSGELSRKEGGKIFGSGSRTPIAITLLVRNPKAAREKAIIYYRDIGDYLSREEKLKTVKQFKTISGEDMNWQVLEPNEHGDWINVRNDAFSAYITIGDRDSGGKNSFFEIYSNGIKTQRDAWIYDSSKKNLSKKITRSIDFYNREVDRIWATIEDRS